MARPTYFCSADWFEAVLNGTRPDRCIVLVGWRGSELVAVLPLERKRNRVGGTDLRFLGHQFYPDPLGLICASEDFEPASRAIKDYITNMPGWHRLVLDFLDAGEASAWGGRSQAQGMAPFLTLPSDFEALLQQFRKKTRYKVRAAISAAEEAGASFCVASEPREGIAFLEQLFRLHALRSTQVGRDSSLAGNAIFALHSHLVGNSPAARLFALVVNGRPAAVLYGFLHLGRFAYYQVAHDPDFASLGPGTVLLSRVIEWCCRNGVEEFDFLQGDEDYKFRWSSGRRELSRVTISSDRTAAQIADWVDGMLDAARSRLRGAA